MKVVILRVLAILMVVYPVICVITFYFLRFYKIDVEVYGERLITVNSSEIVTELENAIREMRFVLDTPEMENEYSFEEAGLSLTLNVDELKKRMDGKIYIRAIDCTEFLSLSLSDEDKAFEILDSLNENHVKSTNAKLKRGKSWFRLKNEKYGNEIVVEDIMERLTEYVSNADHLLDVMASGELRLTITDDDYIKPTIVSSDFDGLMEELDRYESWHISYTNGFGLDYSDLYPFLSIQKNGKVKFNEKKFKEQCYWKFYHNLSSYTTVGNQRKFTTHSGKKINVSGGTYGDRMNYEEEYDFIVNSIKKGNSHDDRVPVKELDMPEKIGNTYIEISISKQHLWYYVNGKLEMETDVVTGKPWKYSTPKGTYFISEKIPGKYLVGEDYKTWVNYWMRLTNSGVGLHDAYWRSRFGKSIYTYNGSHGCINLPKDFAKQLYDVVETKLPVFVY